MPATFSPAAVVKLDELLTRYPTKQAACIPALHLAQKEFGHLHDDALRCVAAYLDLPYAHVYGVATFYTMLMRKQAAPNVLRVCTNVACMLRGGHELLRAFERALDIKKGESTADFTLVEEECIAACANAPAIVCGTRYFLDVKPEDVDRILADLKARPHPESEVV